MLLYTTIYIFITLYHILYIFVGFSLLENLQNVLVHTNTIDY